MNTNSIYRPNLDQFRSMAQTANLIPVVRELSADLETPVSVYIKIMAQNRPSFLLESVEGGEKMARYSFVGLNPRQQIALHGQKVTTKSADGSVQEQELADGQDLLHLLQTEMDRWELADSADLPRFIGGMVGYLGYDTVRFYEKLPETATKVLTIPDALFFLADTLIVFDHVLHRLLILSNARVQGDAEKSYLAAIEEIEKITELLLQPLPAIK